MKKKIQIAVFIFLCSLCIWYAFYQRKNLNTNRDITAGRVEEVNYLSKGSGYFVSYIFTVNGKIINAKSTIPYAKFHDIIFLNSILKGKIFPIVYQKNNPNNSKMLFTNKDFSEYNVKIPLENKAIVCKIDSLLQLSK